MSGTVPVIIKDKLQVLFIGFNPSLSSAEVGHHYAGRNNRFWELLFQSGLTPSKLKPEEDAKLLEYGFGSTNIVARATRSAAELTREDYATGRVWLKGILEQYKPGIAAYVGMGVYKEFSKKRKASFGLQEEECVAGIKDFVLPSPSGLNRMLLSEQLIFYKQLKEFVNK